MKHQRVLFTAACTAALALPLALSAQPSSTARQDSVRRHDMTMRSNGAMMQDTTTRRTTREPRATSQQRYRVQKNGEAAGTLDTPSSAEQMRLDAIAARERARRDSIDIMMQRQRDSLAAIERLRAEEVARIDRARLDSIASAERLRIDSIARADSIEAARKADMGRYRFGGNGWYVGVAGGGSAPTSDFKNIGYNSGLAVNVPIGWHKPNNLLGLRLNLGYNRFSGRNFIGNSPTGSAVTLANPNPEAFSGTLDLTLATPISLMRTVRLYAVGGGGIYNFRNFGGNSALGGFLGNDVLQQNAVSNKTSRSKFGAHAGAGLDWNVGSSAIYLESRFVNVFTDRNDNLSFKSFFGDGRSKTLKFIPLVLGVKLH